MMSQTTKTNYLVTDTTFKYFYKNEKNRKWMLDIIKYYTNIDLSNYKLTDNEINTGSPILKDYRQDLVFILDVHTVIIEMQRKYTKQAEEKNNNYLFLNASNLWKKEYSHTRTTLICFNDYYSRKNRNNALEHYQFTEKNTGIIDDRIERYEIFLPLFHKLKYNDCNIYEKRLWLFSSKSLDEMKKTVDNLEDKKIVEELRRLNMDIEYLKQQTEEWLQLKYQMALEKEYKENQERKLQRAKKRAENKGMKQGIEKGIEKGIEQGIEQGKNQSIITIVHNLYALNTPLEKIAIAVELPIDKVQNILKETT